MNYKKLNKHDTDNGPGVRVSLTVSGSESEDFFVGKVFTAKTFRGILKALDDGSISGFTVLGGEPLHPRNQHTVTTVCRLIKEKYPNKSIWVYTSYDYDEIKDHKITNFIDVIVDGKSIKWEV